MKDYINERNAAIKMLKAAGYVVMSRQQYFVLTQKEFDSREFDNAVVIENQVKSGKH
jgi:biotin operon repressor